MVSSVLPFQQCYLTEIHLTLSQMTNFRLFQIGRVCRRQFQISWKCQKVFQTSRKHCGTRRNCSLRAISPFPTVFSKDLYCRHVKTRACLGKGLTLYHTIPTLNDSRIEGFWKHCEKRRKLRWPAFSPFPKMLLYPVKDKFCHLGLF